MDEYDEDLYMRLKSQGFGEHAASMKIWHNRTFSNPKQKSSTIEFKLKGNKHYAEGELRLALLSYNKALCYAEKGSDDIGVLFANRSAVAFKMKSYPECLKNIQLARQNKIPNEKLLKLKTREEKCLEMISKKEILPKDPENPYNLLYGSIIDPYMIDCLEIVHKNNEYPYLVTNRNLMAGELIVTEKPFLGILMNKTVNSNCSNCMKECIFDLIPCDKCAFVMFCSENCKNSGNQFHQYECGIMDKLILTHDLSFLVFHNQCRALFKALSMFNGSVEKLKTFVEEKNDSYTDVLTLDMRKNEKSFLKTIYSLNNDLDDDVLSEYYLSFYPKIKEMMVDQEMKKFVTRFLSKIIKGIRIQSETEIEFIGGFYPFEVFSSLSCAPNVFCRILNDSKIIYSVQHPIKAGEKLTFRHNCSFLVFDKMERQENISKYFGMSFTCDCVACVNNYPMIHQMKIISYPSYFAAQSRMDIAERMTGIEAFNMIRENFKFINNNFDKYPCREIGMAMLTNSLLLSKAYASKTN